MLRTCLLLIALALHAQDTLVVLKAARMFDGKSNQLVSPGLVVVRDRTIVGVGGAAPGGARVIDLGDATLLPGFMDAHTHLAYAATGGSQRALSRLQLNVSEVALEAAVHARSTLLAGFTTVRDLGSRDLVDIGLRNAIERGLTPGPRRGGLARGTDRTHPSVAVANTPRKKWATTHYGKSSTARNARLVEIEAVFPATQRGSDVAQTRLADCDVSELVPTGGPLSYRELLEESPRVNNKSASFPPPPPSL